EASHDKVRDHLRDKVRDAWVDALKAAASAPKDEPEANRFAGLWGPINAEYGQDSVVTSAYQNFQKNRGRIERDGQITSNVNDKKYAKALELIDTEPDPNNQSELRAKYEARIRDAWLADVGTQFDKDVNEKKDFKAAYSAYEEIYQHFKSDSTVAGARA